MVKKFNSADKLSDVISLKEVEGWKGNVIFDAGTATGKTTFVLTTLSEHCKATNKQILFICNRIALAEEVRELVVKSNISNIKVTTYQAIEQSLRKNIEPNLNFDYLALDEFHHCLETYNIYTDLSYEYLINHPAQKIFMSATCRGLFNILIDEGYVDKSQYYYIPKSYDYVNRFVFYNRKTAHLDIIADKMENTDEKIIYFTQSIKDAVEVYNLYKDEATFYCSKNTTNNAAKTILDANEGRILNEQFDGRLLVATKVLDVGITLKDKQIKAIICNMYDYSSMIQCLGRKRLVDESDTCEFYIRTYSKGQLNLYRNKAYKEMQMFEADRNKYNETYANDREHHNKYIYFDHSTNDLKLNKLAYLTARANEVQLDYMTKYKWMNEYFQEIEGVGYKQFILAQLDVSIDDLRVSDYESYEESKKQNDLITYLDSIIGIPLYKEEQQQLKEEFKRDGLKARSMGLNTLNGNLKDRKLPYIIESEMDNRRSLLDENEMKIKNPNYKKKYWIIGKVIFQ